MKTYTLTITEEQARTISAACDLLCRIGLGQWPEFVGYLPGSRPHHELIDALKKPMAEWLAGESFGGHIINGWNSSLGLGNPHVSERAHIAHDLHVTIRHRLAWDRAIAQGLTDGTYRNWSGGMMGVHFDEPRLYSKQPEATIESTDKQEASQ